MDIAKITEGKKLSYKFVAHIGGGVRKTFEGSGNVVQVYETKKGTRVVLHDKTSNKSLTLRPSQIAALKRK